MITRKTGKNGVSQDASSQPESAQDAVWAIRNNGEVNNLNVNSALATTMRAGESGAGEGLSVGEAESKRTQEAFWRARFWENITEMLRGSEDEAILDQAAERFNTVFDKYGPEASDDEDADEINSIDDVDRVVSRRSLGHTRHDGYGDRAGGHVFGVSHIKVEIGERQIRVNKAIDEASAVTGVPAELSRGLWGVESGFGKKRLSPTGCMGDHQFSKGTFKGVVKAHGDQIPGLEKALTEANGDLLSLRDHPEVSTYAAQYYIKDLADGLGLDVKDRANWGALYAAYNIGPGGVKKLMKLANDNAGGSAMDKLGFVAQANPMFYRGGATAVEALGRYQSVIETRIEDHHRAFGILADKPKEPQQDVKGVIDNSQIAVKKAAVDMTEPKTPVAAAVAPKDVTQAAASTLVDKLMTPGPSLRLDS